MTTFLIFVMALIICAALVTWGCAMVLLRLVPIVVRLYTRRMAYASALRNAGEARTMAKDADTRVVALEAKLKKMEEDQINEVLARRR